MIDGCCYSAELVSKHEVMQWLSFVSLTLSNNRFVSVFNSYIMRMNDIYYKNARIIASSADASEIFTNCLLMSIA